MDHGRVGGALSHRTSSPSGLRKVIDGDDPGGITAAVEWQGAAWLYITKLLRQRCRPILYIMGDQQFYMTPPCWPPRSAS
ncbi:MAG: hypothetical protein R2867_07715 [Caldilineaceae bacterium]